MTELASGYLTAEELSIQNPICVLPCGDVSEGVPSQWSTEDLKYYQMFMNNGTPVDKMFRSFIFNPIRARSQYYMHPMHTGMGKIARSNDWLFFIDQLFLDDYNLKALAQNTYEGEKTDFWITIPYPNHLQNHFGRIAGEKIDFSKESDRVKSIFWWIDNFINRWEKEKDLHQFLTFKGFVWPRSSINTGDEDLVTKTNDYIHQKGLLSIWLFNYGSSGGVEWKDYQFDGACANPNYYGNTETDQQWIVNTTAFAQHFHTGIQIHYGKGKLFDENHIYDYLNLGVIHGYMNNSLVAFQFPNQTMKMIYRRNPIAYEQIHSFINKTFQHYSY